ncbi:hypothetical protein AMTRI_Chr10g3230 [Amborella trichopoda]
MRPPLQSYITKRCTTILTVRLRSRAYTSKHAPASTKPYHKEVYHSSDCEVSKLSMQPSWHAPASTKPYPKEVYHSFDYEASKQSMQPSKHTTTSIKAISQRSVPQFRL